MQFADIFQQLFEWMQGFAVHYGYLGIFLINLIGALSIFFPIPFTAVVFWAGSYKLGGDWVFQPVWIAVAAGIGSAVGEFSGYFLGLGARKAVNQRFEEKMQFLVKVFERFGSVVIFLFALTPLPDDLLFIPLGVMGYGVKRVLVPALIGKFCMNLIVAYSGRFTVQIIKDLFGIESAGISGLIGLVLGFVLLVIVFIVMFKVDWEKYFEGYVDQEGRQ